MKTPSLLCITSIALLVNAWGQTSSPTASPDAMASIAPALSASATPVSASLRPPPPPPAVSATPDSDRDIESVIEKKIRKHFNVSFDHDDSKTNSRDDSDEAWLAIPIVFIVFMMIFGTPVAIVGLIMYFSFSKSRALHRTVRMMVEKGQEVPAALLNPPPVVRQRSDLRRGVVLLMVGLGLMIFFAAVNDWEGGAWSLGIIPFLIGMGYLLVWRLDVRKSPEEQSPPLAEK